jgi:hypothetical protein
MNMGVELIDELSEHREALTECLLMAELRRTTAEKRVSDGVPSHTIPIAFSTPIPQKIQKWLASQTPFFAITSVHRQ